MLMARAGTRALPLQEILEVLGKYISRECNAVDRVPARASMFFSLPGKRENNAPLPGKKE
jgi:hypothetical protein